MGLVEWICRSPRWIDELRARLSAEGKQTVIVTTQAGAEFVQIGRADIEAHLAQLRVRTRVAVWLTTGLAVLIVGGLIGHGWRVAALGQLLDQRELDLQAANFALDVIADAVPGTVAIPLVADEETREARIEAVREFLKRKDTVFRSYVEATGAVMRKQAQEMSSQLANAGLDMGQVRGLFDSMAAGGLPSDPETEELYSYFVGDDVVGSFDELQRLGNFIAALPSARPLPGGYVTSGFGMRRHPVTGRADAHKGIDFVARKNDQIVAAGDGIVRFVGRNGGYGNQVILEHGNEIVTSYAHMSSMSVKVGDVVRAGDVLGVVGSTGLSTGPHLHFEVRFKGRHLDPVKVLKVAAYGN